MVKNRYLLTDSESGDIDAIIEAEYTSPIEIEECIRKAKENNDEWQWDDLVECLPDDCNVYFISDKIYW